MVRRLQSSSGQGLVELLISLTMLTLVVGGLLAVLTSGQLALARSDEKGTALTLAEKQMEIYRGLGYANIRLDQASVNAIGGADPYMTAHASDATIPSGTASGQAIGGVNGENACGSPAPPECLPVQTVTGPDQRVYRVDTYITYVTPDANGRQLKQVTVLVRDGDQAALPILARVASTFDQSNIATG